MNKLVPATSFLDALEMSGSRLRLNYGELMVYCTFATLSDYGPLITIAN